MPCSKPVPLNAVEVKLCEYLARMRTKANRDAGVTSIRKASESDEFIELQGIGGEVAFAKLFGLMPDLNLSLRSKGQNDVGDCYSPALGFIDVKTTQKEAGPMNVRAPVRGVSYYALMTGTFPEFTFRGLAHWQAVFVEAFVSDVGRGPFWAVPQAALEARSDLWVPYI